MEAAVLVRSSLQNTRKGGARQVTRGRAFHHWEATAEKACDTLSPGCTPGTPGTRHLSSALGSHESLPKEATRTKLPWIGRREWLGGNVARKAI